MLGTSKASLGKENKLGKDTLPVELWASGQIEATPYGTFERMMNNNKKKHGNAAGNDMNFTTEPRMNATMESHIMFDHYQYPTGKAAILAEMPRGKRVHQSTVYSDPGQAWRVLPKEVEANLATIKRPDNYSWLANHGKVSIQASSNPDSIGKD